MKPTTKDIEKPKDSRTGTGRVCAGTNNPGVNRKIDNPLKRTHNPITWKPENPIKGIWNLVPNEIWSQRKIGLTIPL